MTEKSGEKLVEEFNEVIQGCKPNDVMLALCSTMCAIQHKMGTSSNEQFADAIKNTITDMLEGFDNEG